MEDWISRYVAYLDGARTNELFKRWAAVSAISAVLHRRVWSMSSGDPVFPNMYVLLCGPSAAGKGEAIKPAERLLKEVSAIDAQLHLGTGSFTSAAMADALDRAQITINGPTGVEKVNAITVVSREFGVFLPEYDKRMLGLLTDLFDCLSYHEERRGSSRKEPIDLDRTCVTILGGTTPAYLQNTLPEGAWEEGFMSRMIVVFGGGQKIRAIEEEAEGENETLGEELFADLRKIAKREGRVYWSRPALEAFNKWLLGGMKPVPNHPKLQYYNDRRHYNLMKLCIIHACSAGHEKIEEEDFLIALDLLLETEVHMADVFKAMKTGGASQVLREAVHYIWQMHLATKEPVPHAKLIRFLHEKAPVHEVQRLAEVMVQAEMLTKVEVNKIGTCYMPNVPRAP